MLGNYQKVRKIGSGSFGEVYEVRKQSTGEQFAIKKIPIGKDTQPSADNQIKSLSKMKHPNILRIHEYFYDQDQQGQMFLYLVLQYCRNEDLLAHFAKNRKSFPSVEREALSIFKQIVTGCIALHEKGIIHRDLKPENVLLNGNVVKIADFGCAKILEKHLKAVKLTYNIGTPIYSAPEVFNQWKYDQRCDVWSAGVILYFMIYGTVPFLEKSLPKLKVVVETKTKQSEIELPNYPEISSETSSLIKGMLKFNQEERLVWGEIVHSRLFNPQMADIEGYISYIIEVNKILAWLLQSLLSFSEHYSSSRLSKLIILYNQFIECNMQFISTILQKHSSTIIYFKSQKLKDHHFSEQIIQNIIQSRTKLNHYLEVMNQKFKDKQESINQNRSGRYHLWLAQEQARIIAANANSSSQSNSFKRSLYCLFVLAGFDRFLGEQHYLTLDSHEFIEGIKQMQQGELEKRIQREMERIV